MDVKARSVLLSSPGGVANLLAAPAARALEAAHDEIRDHLREAAGGPFQAMAEWQVVRQVLLRLENPEVMRVLLRLAVEVALGFAFPWVRPLLPVLDWVLTSLTRFRPAGWTDDHEELARSVLTLLSTPPGQLSPPALIALSAPPTAAEALFDVDGEKLLRADPGDNS